jgi:hypothetical protein
VYADVTPQYVEVMSLQPGWRDILNQYDVQLVPVEKDSALAAVLSDDPGWHEAYAGEVERLFERNASRVLALGPA